jgi:hypothetical protein
MGGQKHETNPLAFLLLLLLLWTPLPPNTPKDLAKHYAMNYNNN